MLLALLAVIPMSPQAFDNWSWQPPAKLLAESSGKMLFSSERNGSLSLFTKNFNQQQTKLVVKAAVSGRGEYEPSISPDGKYIAFTTYRYGGWKIAISDIDGRNIRRVTMDPHYAYDPTWSNDGKKLTYRRIVNNGGPYFRGQADIFQINIDGSGNRNLSKTPDGGDRKPAYSPDGKQIIYDSFAGDDGEQLWLMLMDADGKNLHRIKSQSDSMFAPSWSPDGQWVAHLRAEKEGYIDVWVMKADGSEARNLTMSKTRGLSKANGKIRHWQYDTNWSLDGRTISFVGNYLDNDNIDIYAVNFEASSLSRLTNHKADDLHPYWY